MALVLQIIDLPPHSAAAHHVNGGLGMDDTAWTIGLDWCDDAWIFGVSDEFTFLGILSVAIGPLRINITWPVIV